MDGVYLATNALQFLSKTLKIRSQDGLLVKTQANQETTFHFYKNKKKQYQVLITKRILLLLKMVNFLFQKEMNRLILLKLWTFQRRRPELANMKQQASNKKCMETTIISLLRVCSLMKQFLKDIKLPLTIILLC